MLGAWEDWLWPENRDKCRMGGGGNWPNLAIERKLYPELCNFLLIGFKIKKHAKGLVRPWGTQLWFGQDRCVTCSVEP